MTLSGAWTIGFTHRRRISSDDVDTLASDDDDGTFIPDAVLEAQLEKNRNKREMRRRSKIGAKGVYKYYGSVPKEAEKRNLWLEPVDVKGNIPVLWLEVANSTYEGLMKGYYPERTSQGTGGTYYMMDVSGKPVAVFKPVDEEPYMVNNPNGYSFSTDGEGIRKGTTPGDGAFKEMAAYVLDHQGFAGVPPTFLVTCFHEAFNHPNDVIVEKTGSLQMFVENVGSCDDLGSGLFSVEQVHRISVLDIRMANADRHFGNILARKVDGNHVLVPIDHGYCLPTMFQDCSFGWLNWPQSRKPFSSEAIDYITSLDAEEDIKLLNAYGWKIPPACARTLRISTMLLKKGVKKGLTPYAIGNIMCRKMESEPSMIEHIVTEIDLRGLDGSRVAIFLDALSHIMDRYLDSVPQ